ncbi:MAG: choice-of-anchor Q domain-containing protein [Candidatus Nanopelagicales bacterium]
MRRLILMLLVAAGLIVLHQSAASAADFTVNSNGDGADAVPGNGVCATAGGACTLRAAVMESESLAGSDTISLPAMTISLGSQLTITKTTTIRGAGPRATIVTGTPGHILLSIGGGDVVVRDLALQGASANGGGGLAVQQVGNAASKLTNVRIANNTITGAVGTAYGPVYLIAGEMEILRSSITGNSTTSAGQVQGGGIYVAGATTRLLVENSTVHANSAVSSSASFGGGLMALNNSVTTVRSSTITDNIAGNTVSLAGYGGNIHRQAQISVENSIVANGAAALGSTANCSGSVDFSGRNIVSDNTCGAANASRSITNPLLGPLVTTTGGTDFRVPASASPALDAAVGCTLTTDQREQVRPIGAACDLGAVEVGADVSVSQTVSNPAPSAGADVVFTVVAGNAGKDDAAGTTLAVNLPGSATITSVSSSQGSCSTAGLSVNCAFGTIDRDAQATVLVVARAPASGPMTSTATATAPIVDPNPGNNSATVTATVPGGTPPASPPPACSNSIRGNKKANKLRGTGAGDTMKGLGGKDVLRGLGGDDCLNGGRGNDRVIAGPGSDRLIGGKGRDIMLGGGGPDVIKARDGQRDVIKCGSGQDTVLADKSDRVAKDCEKVRRK